MTNIPLFFFPSGSEEAALGGADRKGSGQTPRLLLCPAGGARHRGPGHSDGGAVRLADAAGQLHQPKRGTHRYGSHLGQDAELQGGGVREGGGRDLKSPQYIRTQKNINNRYFYGSGAKKG